MCRASRFEGIARAYDSQLFVLVHARARGHHDEVQGDERRRGMVRFGAGPRSMAETHTQHSTLPKTLKHIAVDFISTCSTFIPSGACCYVWMDTHSHSPYGRPLGEY